MEEGTSGSTSSSSSRKKRPLPLPLPLTQQSGSKRPRSAAAAAAAEKEQEDDDDDLAFLLRLRSEEAQQESAAAAAAAGSRKVRAIVQQLRKHPHDEDTDDEEDEDENENEDQGPGHHRRQQQQHHHHQDDDNEERPQTIFRALELLDFNATQALLAADPDLVSHRDTSADNELCMPLAVAIASRFDRGCKLLLSQQEPPCPLGLLDGRGYSALHLAVEAYADMPFLLRFLLQYRGVDINCAAPLADGATPLHAVPPEDDKALRLLLASGADPSMRDTEGRTALDVVNASWPAGSKAKKRARHWLTRRAPLQSYALHKLRLVARLFGEEGKEDEKEDEGAPSSSAAAAAAAAAAAVAGAFVAGLARAAREKLLEMRLEAQTQLVGAEGQATGGPDGGGGGGSGEGAADDEEDRILCRLETTGVYSFVSSAGRLCLARVDRSVSPLLLAGGAAAPAQAAAPAASVASSSSATTSPSSSPLTSTTPEALQPPAMAATAAVARPGGGLSPTCCPLSRLRAARADIFDLGQADAETILSLSRKASSSDGAGGGGGGVAGESEAEAAPWVLLPPLPRVHLHPSRDGNAKGEEDLPAAVLRHVVYELKEERVFDALQAMLWR